ncbi:unnamed protein product [Rotaria magnacalcarata]|uniref:Uncharacterized protein n=1 Tax=Rotaria magnacalcarata TaxID=392030 RepID=A0A8S2T2F7_9BILA|nr:unnamed protein product [Rotaria magnacalcarata]
MTTTLRLLLPRATRDQSIIVNTTTSTIPPSISSNRRVVPFSIPTEWLVELFVFNGTLYFETTEEQTAYCHLLGVCLKPRSAIEEDAFQKGWLTVDGFVGKSDHHKLLQLNQCRFHPNPLIFIRKLIENRNNMHAPLTSHVASILINAFKQPL